MSPDAATPGPTSYCSLPTWVREGNPSLEKVYEGLLEKGLSKPFSPIAKKDRLVYGFPGETKEANCLIGQLTGRAQDAASRIFGKLFRIDKNGDGSVEGTEFLNYVYQETRGDDPELYEDDIPPLAQELWRFSTLYTLATTEPPKPDAGVTPLAAPPPPPKLPEAVLPPPKPRPAPPPPPPDRPTRPFDLRELLKDHWPWLAGAATVALVGLLIYLRRPRPMFDLVVNHGGGYFRKLFPVTKWDGQFLAGRFGVQRTRIGWEIQREQVRPFRDFIAGKLGSLKGDVQVHARGRMGILDDYLKEARLAAQGTEPPKVVRPPRITGTEPTVYAPEVSGAAARRPSGPQPAVRVDESRLVPDEPSLDEALGGRPREVSRPEIRTPAGPAPATPPPAEEPTWLREEEEAVRKRLEDSAADKPPPGKPPGDS